MSIKEYDLGPVRGDINDSAATFTQAATRENINSGETGKTIFGKIKKHFADMTLSAFATIVNNATTTVANTVLDGRMGKTLMDKINELNHNKEIVYQADFGTGGGCITFNPAINKVYIDGVVENASNGGTIFTLPLEYRPKKTLVFYNPCRQNGAAALYNLTIYTDGQVKANAFTNATMTELRISASFIK